MADHPGIVGPSGQIHFAPRNETKVATIQIIDRSFTLGTQIILLGLSPAARFLEPHPHFWTRPPSSSCCLQGARTPGASTGCGAAAAAGAPTRAAKRLQALPAGRRPKAADPPRRRGTSWYTSVDYIFWLSFSFQGNKTGVLPCVPRSVDELFVCGKSRGFPLGFLLKATRRGVLHSIPGLFNRAP